MLRIRVVALLAALGVLLPGHVWAFDKITTGHLRAIEVNPDGGFGIWLLEDTLCTNVAGAWFDAAGGDGTIEGQKALLATVAAAELSGSTVTVYTNLSPTIGCRIVVVDLNHN